MCTTASVLLQEVLLERPELLAGSEESSEDAACYLGDAWGCRLYLYRLEVASNQPTPLDSRALVPPPYNLRFRTSWRVLMEMLGLSDDQVHAIYEAFAPKLEAYIKFRGPVVLHGAYQVVWRDRCLMLT